MTDQLHHKKRLLAVFCALIVGSDASSAWAAEIRFEGQCPAKGNVLPSPWKIQMKAPLESVIYNSPHFSAPFSAFGVPIEKSRLSNGANLFVSLRDCGRPTDLGYSQTPCGMMASVVDATTRGGGFKDGLRKVYGLNIGHRYIWPDDHEYVGICDLVRFDQEIKAEPLSTCRIWLPEKSEKRGLYIVVPGETFPSIPKLIDQVRMFFQPEYSGCAIANNYWGFIK